METFLFHVKEQPAGVNQNFHPEWQAEVHQGRVRPLISWTLDLVSIFRCQIFLKKKENSASAGFLFGSGMSCLCFISAGL